MVCRGEGAPRPEAVIVSCVLVVDPDCSPIQPNVAITTDVRAPIKGRGLHQL